MNSNGPRNTNVKLPSGDLLREPSCHQRNKPKGDVTGPFRIATPAETDLWDAYVDKHPKASIFHTRQMVQVYSATHKHQPLAVTAVNQHGIPVAMIVSVLVKTLPGFASRFASRAIMFAEPICNDDEEGIQGLTTLLLHHDRWMKRRALFAEVRPMWDSGAERMALEKSGYQYLEYPNFVIDTSRSPEELWNAMPAKFRSEINRAEKKGVEVAEDSSPSGAQALYKLLQSSYGRSRVPLPDESLLQSAIKYLPHDYRRLAIANYQGRPVAGSLDLIFKGVVYGWYSGIERVPGVSANGLASWKVIEWASQNGHRIFDFGGAGWPGEDYGPANFKARFGGQLVHYGRYRKTYSPWKLWMAERAYQCVRGLIAPRRKQAAEFSAGNGDSGIVDD